MKCFRLLSQLPSQLTDDGFGGYNPLPETV